MSKESNKLYCPNCDKMFSSASTYAEHLPCEGV